MIAVLDEGVRALAEAMAGGRREEGILLKGGGQGRMLLPKLLTLTLNVFGLKANEPEVTALLHALLWACPRLERLDMHIPNLYGDTALAMEGMVTAVE